jgi:hypothetical protein
VVADDVAARKVTRRLELPTTACVTEKDWDFEAPHHGFALTDDGATLLPRWPRLGLRRARSRA